MVFISLVLETDTKTIMKILYNVFLLVLMESKDK